MGNIQAPKTAAVETNILRNIEYFRCEKEGFFSVDGIETLVGKDLTDKHKTSRLETGKWYSK